MESLPYNDFSSWMRRHLPFRVQKISVDAGFSCPNRDGRIATGGCTFCDNSAFSPPYCNAQKSVAQQLADGIKFFQKDTKDMRYLAYFQSFTSTYGSLSSLKSRFQEALSVDRVAGIVVATRPDCVSADLLDYLQELASQVFVLVEFGIESANDETLRSVNRGHDFACACNAIGETVRRGLFTGGHVILGLPGEDAAESLRQADIVGQLPLNVLKIHQLQIIKGTPLARQHAQKPIPTYDADEYMRLVAAYVQRLPERMAVDRFVAQSPPHMVLAPRWGIKPDVFAHRLQAYMHENGLRQGQLFRQKKHDGARDETWPGADGKKWDGGREECAQ